LCRTVEDCAIVFHAVAKADERDPSVIDLPFNWDADLDVTKLRVGYLEPAFREANRNEDLKKSDQQALDELRRLGVKLEPFELPKLPNNVTGGILGAESGASFDEFVRSGRDKNMTNRGRGNGFRSSRLVPAVEYLQAQRVRGMVMRQFADAVSKFDVYVVPFTNSRGGPGGPGRGGRGTEDEAGRGAEAGRGDDAARGAGAGPGRGRGGRGGAAAPSSMGTHFQIANLCGYPAVAVPHGFTAAGQPTSITFLGRLYNESQILALAKAYQDAAGWHLKHPTLT
jgi:Asp-tRNA(Asn)/Glu-tRNA(Gln) amidotransferase A subunit family amidase